MSDRRQCTALASVPIPVPPPVPPPLRFNADAALRETFSRRLRPEDREALAAVCDAVLELTYDATFLGGRIGFGGVRDEATAAAAELRYVAAYLAWSVEEARGDSLATAEHRLADAEERAAEQLLVLAAELDAGADAAVEVVS